MKKEIFSSPQGPKAIGPYSQAIRAGNLIFISGQLPLSPFGGEIKGDIRGQTRQVLENIQAILTSSGGALRQVVKTTVFLKDLKDFSAMNEVYQEYFKEDPPARSCVEVGGIPRGALVEIESIAAIEGRPLEKREPGN